MGEVATNLVCSDYQWLISESVQKFKHTANSILNLLSRHNFNFFKSFSLFILFIIHAYNQMRKKMQTEVNIINKLLLC